MRLLQVYNTNHFLGKGLLWALQYFQALTVTLKKHQKKKKKISMPNGTQ